MTAAWRLNLHAATRAAGRAVDQTPWVEIMPGRCAGTPTFNGTRIHARTPAGELVAGNSPANILKLWPSLTMAHVILSLWYVAEYGSKRDRKAVKRWWKAHGGELTPALATQQ